MVGDKGALQALLKGEDGSHRFKIYCLALLLSLSLVLWTFWDNSFLEVPVHLSRLLRLPPSGNLTNSCGFSHESESMPDAIRRGYVMTLPEADGEPGRYSRFLREWTAAYPALDMQQIKTFRAPRRGLGILAGNIHAVDRAIEDNVDTAIFLEDDAKPFKPVDAETWKAQFDKLLMRWPNNSMALFLGAHNIRPHRVDPKKLSRSPELLESGIIRADDAWGAYAYVVRKSHLRCLSKYLRDLVAQDSRAYSHDAVWWKGLFKTETPAYVSAPLLVDHHPGFSMTWGRNRSDAWMGKRQWWK
mmetsp:Transcript_18416/g.44338  ORF Transcript_18416/g.44338 Transcript_18416/m.44338 type:complete len:301 (+) Transcript_18416:163-1065(+)